jgi:TRAP-type C4-dicarboxylate transport system permease small subunit
MKEKIDNIISRLLIIIISVMVINVTWQVISRFAAKYKLITQPSSFTDELASFLLIWVGLLGAAYATGKNLHLAIDISPRKASPANQKIYKYIIQASIILFAVTVMIIGGSNLVYMTLILGQKSPTLKIPMGYVYAIVPLSGVLITYYSLTHLFGSKKS